MYFLETRKTRNGDTTNHGICNICWLYRITYTLYVGGQIPVLDIVRHLYMSIGSRELTFCFVSGFNGLYTMIVHMIVSTLLDNTHMAYLMGFKANLEYQVISSKLYSAST